jgi:hypothetical protein
MLICKIGMLKGLIGANMFLKKIIFLCAIPFAAFSGKKSSINENKHVSGIALIYQNSKPQNSEPFCYQKEQINILREDLKNNPSDAMSFLKEKGIEQEINLINLIDNTDKKSWCLLFRDSILNQEQSIEYFKKKLPPEQCEIFSTHVASKHHHDQDPYIFYGPLATTLYILNEASPLLLIAYNNNYTEEVLEMFNKLTISSQEPEEQPYKTKPISKKRFK